MISERARGVGGGHGYMHALGHFVLHQMGCARVVEVKPSAGTSSYRPTPMQWRTKGDIWAHFARIKAWEIDFHPKSVLHVFRAHC